MAEKVMIRVNGRNYVGTLRPFKDGVFLFKTCGSNWWLYYSPKQCTGAFKTKAAAMDWYNRGGR